MRIADAIICSDIHIRDSVPECRTDDFFAAQTKKLQFISHLQEINNCPVFMSGDLFHHWKPSPELMGYALRQLPNNLIGIPGQHDLPAHSLDNIERSGIDAVEAGGKIMLLSPTHKNQAIFHNDIYIAGFPWGVPLCGTPNRLGMSENATVALIHYLVYKGEEPFPGAANHGGTAKSIMRKMPGFNLIISGDNHQTFTERVGRTLLVNPGSMMRTTAAQADHKPCVFLWYAKENEVVQVFLPIEQGVVSREHIDVVQEKNVRLDAYVKSLVTPDTDITLSFKDNMKSKLAANDVHPAVQKLIYTAMGV